MTKPKNGRISDDEEVWCVDGVALEARHLALSAAAAGGSTVGEWLDWAIRQQTSAEYPANSGDDPLPPDENGPVTPDDPSPESPEGSMSLDDEDSATLDEIAAIELLEDGGEEDGGEEDGSIEDGGVEIDDAPAGGERLCAAARLPVPLMRTGGAASQDVEIWNPTEFLEVAVSQKAARAWASRYAPHMAAAVAVIFAGAILLPGLGQNGRSATTPLAEISSPNGAAHKNGVANGQHASPHDSARWREAGYSPNGTVIVPDVSLVTSTDEIVELQRMLSWLNFETGAPDGALSERTVVAIRLYQHFAGLKADGKASTDLLEHLRGVVIMLSPDHL